MNEGVIVLLSLYDRLNCHLSGGTLRGSGSPINSIKTPSCCVIDLKPLICYSSSLDACSVKALIHYYGGRFYFCRANYSRRV